MTEKLSICKINRLKVTENVSISRRNKLYLKSDRKPKYMQAVNEERPEKSAEISKSLLQE